MTQLKCDDANLTGLGIDMNGNLLRAQFLENARTIAFGHATQKASRLVDLEARKQAILPHLQSNNRTMSDVGQGNDHTTPMRGRA